jgi:hypothetical protein
MTDPQDTSRREARKVNRHAHILEYRQALGHFVETYAKVESAIQLTLWHWMQLPHAQARVIFSGTRTDTASGYLRRLMSLGVTDEVRASMESILDQLGHINTMRNSILHYGAVGVEDGEGVTSNALIALSPAHERAFPVSTTIIKDMTDDLASIIVRLRVRHMGLPALPGGPYPLLERRLNGAWRYKTPPSPQQKSPKPDRSGRAKGKARSAPPAPSQG